MDNGMIDKQFNCYLDFNQSLAICKRNLTKDEYKLRIDIAPTLIEYFQEKGNIENELLEEKVLQ